MAKPPSAGRRSRTTGPKAAGRRTSTGEVWGWAVPIAVLVVVLVLIVGAIVTNENRRAAAAELSAATPAGLSVPVITVEPQATEPIPDPNVDRISLKDTQTKLEAGQAVLIDVRSQDAYDQGHATGALSIPEEQIESRLGELPRDKLLILYCT